MEIFGELPTGEKVHRFTLEGGGLKANFLSYGTVLQDLRLDGVPHALVLGFEQFDSYLSKSPYFGATAGRCANRIREGHLALNSNVYQLDQNFLGKHHLHGGAKSMGKRLWDALDYDQNSVTFGIRLVDSEMGYPGNLDAVAKFTLLPEGILDIQYSAKSDQLTVCNLAHHSYFNLSGEDTILDHHLYVDAERFLPVDDELIPTGEQRQVEGTVLDFRQPKPISNASEYCLVDHNFCVSKQRQNLREVVSLRSEKSNVVMRCLTTEPGVQIYDGKNVQIDQPGLDGKLMNAHAGIAIEPQIWPDANHHAAFPTAILAPGDEYRQHTQYIFTKEAG